MIIVYKNMKDGEVKVRVENVDDLWYLSAILDAGDLVKGETERKIKIGDSANENTRVVRKKMFLALRVEKVEFSKYANTLRILGTIEEGPEDIPRGAYHSFSIEVNDELRMAKESWLKYQLEKLDEATRNAPSILVVVFDREEALFGVLKSRGFEVVAKMKGDVAKKAVDEKKSVNFYKEIAVQMEDLVKRLKIAQVIAASHGFWKDYLAKEVPSGLKEKVTYATCSDVSAAAINELLKRPELKSVLEKDRTTKEDVFVEKLLEAIAKGKAAYGIDEVEEKTGEGAVLEVMLTDNFIQKARQEETFKRAEVVMKSVEKSGGKVHILSTDDAVRRLDALGGIAGILRWK